MLLRHLPHRINQVPRLLISLWRPRDAVGTHEAMCSSPRLHVFVIGHRGTTLIIPIIIIMVLVRLAGIGASVVVRVIIVAAFIITKYVTWC